MYELASNWKGQYLPPGAAGMPANHPYQFTYARPRYIPGRGFSGLGRRRRGMGQAVFTPGEGQLYGCTVQSVPACGFFDNFGTPSVNCQAGIAACVAAAKAAMASPAAGSTTPGTPGALVLTQTGVGIQIDPSCVNAADPASCTAALALQASSNAQIAAMKAAAAGAINANPCPYETDDSGACCAAGQVIDANGNCSTPFSMPWWGWAAVVGVGVLLVVKS